VRYFLLKTRALLMNQSYILVIFVLISYTLLGPLSVKFPILGDLKPYHIALAVASIVLCLIIISSPRSVYRSLPILVVRFWGLYLVFLIVITMSAFKGLDFGKSYSLWRNYVANLFLVTLVALTIKHERQINVVLYTLLGITIIGAILGGLQAVASPRISLAYLVGGERWLMEHGFSPVGYAHMPYKFGNDMLVGFLPALSLFLGYGLSIERSKIVQFLLFLLILVLILGGLVLSLGLTSLMGSAVGAIYIAHKFRVFYKKIILIPVTFIIFIGILFSQKIITWLVNTYTSYQDILNRWHLVLAGLQMLETSPLTGIGLANFSALSPRYLLKVSDRIIVTSPHNIFLEILVENGVIGLFLYLIIWWYAFRACSLSDIISLKNSNLKFIGIGLRGTLIGYAVDALFHNYTFDNHLWLIIGLCFSVGNLVLSSKSEFI